MVLAVALSKTAQIPTMATATSDCISAEAKARSDAAPRGLLVGHQIGRDHRLAMAGAGGVKDAIGKGDREQRPHRRAVGLGGANGRGNLAIEFRLSCQQPSDNATELRPGALGRGSPNGVCAITARSNARMRSAAARQSARPMQRRDLGIRGNPPEFCWRTSHQSSNCRRRGSSARRSAGRCCCRRWAAGMSSDRPREPRPAGPDPSPHR